jgi:Flp pilus assembly protein TadG
MLDTVLRMPCVRAASPARRGPTDAARISPRCRRERGAATLELTVLFPVLMLLIFGVIQGALFFHGRAVVLAAAEQGVRAGRLDGQPNRAGTAELQARQFLADTGELNNLFELSIVPAVDAEQVRLTVTARTVSLLPGMPGPRVSQTAAGPIERFTSRRAP